MKNFNAGMGNLNVMKSVIANMRNMRNAKKNIKIKAKRNKEASNKVALDQKNETNKLNIQRRSHGAKKAQAALVPVVLKARSGVAVA